MELFFSAMGKSDVAGNDKSGSNLHSTMQQAAAAAYRTPSAAGC